MSVSSEVCILMSLGEKMVAGSVVGCAENIINTMVFVRFHFLHVCSELVGIQSTFGCLFSRFLGTLGSLFLIFEGLGSRSENR